APGQHHPGARQARHQPARLAAARRPPTAGHVSYPKGRRGLDPAITVHIAGDRQGSTDNVGGLAGVTFRATGNGTGAPTGECTTTSAGDCTINVTATAAQTYTVGPVGAIPAGWFENPGLGIYNGTNPPSTNSATQYSTVTTPSIAAGGTATVPVASNTSAIQSRMDRIAFSRTDTPDPTECGLHVGLLIDLSSSITSDVIQKYRDAAKSFVTALQGTPSEVAVHTFGTDSPVPGANNSNTDLHPVATEQDAQTVRDKIGGLTVPANPAQYTNWDAGVDSFTRSNQKYDVVIMLTDGDPTRYGRPTATALPGGTGVETRFRDVENAIYSSNTLKSSEGATVQHPSELAVGISSTGVLSPGSIANLRSITGDGDYFTSDFDQLGQQLRDLAHQECRGTISVVKHIIPYGKSIGDAKPGGAGWSFTSTTPAETRETDDTSSVNFDTSHTAPAPTTITEHQNPHYKFRHELTSCHIPGSDQPVTYERHEDGMTVTPDVNEPVVCDVYNEGPIPRIHIVKDVFPDQFSVPGEELRYTFTVTNTGVLPLHDINVHDDKLGHIECPRDELGPGESMTCEFIHYTTEDDVAEGNIHNVVRVTGRDPDGSEAEDEDDATVREVHGPHIELEKVAFPTQYAVPGEVITYTYRVANTGDVTLHDVALHDSRLGAVSCPHASLEPGQEMECTGHHTVTQEDVDAGHIHNVGAVCGHSPRDTRVCDDDDATVTAHHGPGLQIEKLTSPGTFTAAGQTIRYTYHVTNTGNVTLRDIRVGDSRIGRASCERTTLRPGESTTCTARYTTTQADVAAGHIPNFAFARGRKPDGDLVTTRWTEAIVTGLPEVPVTG
ncbi:MAG: VWA domain-containing protein, partial [Nocardiopsaceae bacterium]|nr:VWA domain-containing protein [Nocardiopsaceae bacterium]